MVLSQCCQGRKGQERNPTVSSAVFMALTGRGGYLKWWLLDYRWRKGKLKGTDHKR